jgi:hypothetical protein
MNGDQEFEERLKRQALRSVPAAWREEILGAAREAAGKDAFHRVPDPLLRIWGRGGTRPYRALVASVAARLVSNLIWPSGKAWGALAGVWVLIIGLSLMSGDGGDTRVGGGVAPRSALVRELLQEQGRLFVELAGPSDDGEAVEPKRWVPRPRSERGRECGRA